MIDPTQLGSRRSSFADYDDYLDDLIARGGTDGLPVVPPTPRRVAEALDAAGLAPDAVLGGIPTREVVITAEPVAINAVMAGCRPEYVPIVVAAVRAMCHELANAHGTLATLAGAWHPVIVNGPIAARLGFNAGTGCLGPGTRANATVGRAMRLAMRNVAHAVPGFTDRGAYSHPARYSFCFAEDEALMSWNPLHVERGWNADDDVVSVTAVMDTYTFHSTTQNPESLIVELAHLSRSRSIVWNEFLGETRTVLFLIGPKHRRVFESNGWSKADVRAALFPLLTAEHTFPPGVEATWGAVSTGDADELSWALPCPENIHLIACGGPGDESQVLYPHQGTTVSAQITTDGTPGRTVPAER